MARFRVAPELSFVAIYARSNVGPIRWEGSQVSGSFEAEVVDSTIDTSVQPLGRIEMELERLTSGNSVYDAELMRRLEARRYPVTAAELSFLDAAGRDNRYHVQGGLTVHGVTRAITGTVAVEIEGDGAVEIYGEKIIDIRDFNIPTPRILMLRIYPDVRVRVKLVAEREP